MNNFSNRKIFVRDEYLGKTSIPHQNVIRDDFKSLEEIDNAVKEVGLLRSQLIFGIDYTISNLETGKDSFNGLSLHHIQEGLFNPYQNVRVISHLQNSIRCVLGHSYRWTNVREIRLGLFNTSVWFWRSIDIR